MDTSSFKEKLHLIFENCDYSSVLKEEPEAEKVKFVHTNTDGTVYNIEVEPGEQEFYVFQDGKQIDLFNMNLVDQDGAVTKDKRQAIVKDYQTSHGGSTQQPASTPEPPPASTPESPETAVQVDASPLAENAEILKK